MFKTLGSWILATLFQRTLLDWPEKVAGSLSEPTSLQLPSFALKTRSTAINKSRWRLHVSPCHVRSQLAAPALPPLPSPPSSSGAWMWPQFTFDSEFLDFKTVGTPLNSLRRVNAALSSGLFFGGRTVPWVEGPSLPSLLQRAWLCRSKGIAPGHRDRRWGGLGSVTARTRCPGCTGAVGEAAPAGERRPPSPCESACSRGSFYKFPVLWWIKAPVSGAGCCKFTHLPNLL